MALCAPALAQQAVPRLVEVRVEIPEESVVTTRISAVSGIPCELGRTAAHCVEPAGDRCGNGAFAPPFALYDPELATDCPASIWDIRYVPVDHIVYGERQLSLHQRAARAFDRQCVSSANCSRTVRGVASLAGTEAAAILLCSEVPAWGPLVAGQQCAPLFLEFEGTWYGAAVLSVTRGAAFAGPFAGNMSVTLSSRTPLQTSSVFGAFSQVLQADGYEIQSNAGNAVLASFGPAFDQATGEYRWTELSAIAKSNRLVGSTEASSAHSTVIELRVTVFGSRYNTAKETMWHPVPALRRTKVLQTLRLHLSEALSQTCHGLSWHDASSAVCQ